MALVGVELETLVFEPDTLTTRPIVKNNVLRFDSLLNSQKQCT